MNSDRISAIIMMSSAIRNTLYNIMYKIRPIKTQQIHQQTQQNTK